MRILVTGKDGQVGRELCARPQPGWEVVPLGRKECDLSDLGGLRDLVRRLEPEIIINAAAYTAVDQAERERDLCFAVNADAPRALAEEAARLGALLIHYSTDYVFNGEKAGPYRESDAPDPLNVYGASKAAGEKAITDAAGRHLILRTSWVYGAQGKNFLRTMLRLATERAELRVVDDQVGSPTSAGAIAAATWRLAGAAAEHAGQETSGIYHMTASGSSSWCGFARAILEGSALRVKPRVIPIPTSEYPTPAKRPKNSLLANDKFEETFGFRLGSWTEQLSEVLGVLERPQ